MRARDNRAIRSDRLCLEWVWASELECACGISRFRDFPWTPPVLFFSPVLEKFEIVLHTKNRKSWSKPFEKPGGGG